MSARLGLWVGGVEFTVGFGVQGLGSRFWV